MNCIFDQGVLCSSCNRLLVSAAHSVPILQRENETGGRKAMIFSSVQSKEDLVRCPQAIQKAVLYAMQTDFDALEDGRQEIDGDRMFANLFHLTSRPAEKVSPEGHKEYADVQFWLSGEEWCGVAPRTGKEVCVRCV